MHCNFYLISAHILYAFTVHAAFKRMPREECRWEAMIIMVTALLANQVDGTFIPWAFAPLKCSYSDPTQKHRFLMYVVHPIHLQERDLILLLALNLISGQDGITVTVKLGPNHDTKEWLTIYLSVAFVLYTIPSPSGDVKKHDAS